MGGENLPRPQEPSPAPGVLPVAAKPLPLQGTGLNEEANAVEEEDEEDENEEEEVDDEMGEDEFSVVTNAVDTGLQSAIDDGDIYDV